VRGGMGLVYRATQLRLTRTVALKLVTPNLARDASFRERFRREWMIAASIDHPNVIPVYEAGEEDGVLYIAMRWVVGTDLRRTIDASPLDPARAAHVVAQVASALDAAHERGLIHRDVKPANILMTGDDHVYLTDFGLTKHASSVSGLTKSGQWVGTVDYMAPEQIEGTDVTPRTDIYSLGCVLFEALTGRTPYTRENDLAKLWAHVYTAPPSVRQISPDVPAQFDDILQRAMAKDPGERYATAGDLGRAVLSAAGTAKAPAQQSAGAASPPPQPPRDDSIAGSREPWRARLPNRRVLAAIVGGLLVTIAAAAIVALSGSGDEPQSEGAAPAISGSSTAPLQTGATWRKLPPMPTGRQNMVGTVLDGNVWVLGGLAAGSKGSPRVEAYDPVVNGWKSGPDLPARLHHEMAVTYKDQVVVMGGWIPAGSDPSAKVSDQVFVLRGGTWERLPSLNRPRAAGAAAVVDDQIVVVGGQSDGRLVDSTEVFDGERWKAGKDIPTPREHLAAASDGRFLYAVGGRALSPDKNSAALERYDPAADRWQRLPDMPTARGGLGAAITEGHLLAVGGETATDVLGVVESYNLARQDWSRERFMRTPRHGIAVAAIDGALYAIGGGTRPGHASASPIAEALQLTR